MPEDQADSTTNGMFIGSGRTAPSAVGSRPLDITFAGGITQQSSATTLLGRSDGSLRLTHIVEGKLQDALLASNYTNTVLWFCEHSFLMRPSQYLKSHQ